MALFRVMFGVLIIADLWFRSYYIHEHYSDIGVWPLMNAVSENRYSFSFHYISGSYGFQAFMMLLAAFCAFCSIIGWHTRFFVVMNWLMLCSIQNRNPYLLDGGDEYIRMFSFWAMFLPLGERFSIDSMPHARSKHSITNTNNGGCNNMKGSDGSSYYLSLGTFSTWGQFTIIYMFTAYLKWGEEWTKDLTATQYALKSSQIARPFGYAISDYTLLLKFLTWGVLWFEKLGPFMAVSPFWSGPMKSLAVLGFWLMHIGFGACIALGQFVVVPGVCSLVFLPGWFWEVLVPYVRARLPLPKAYRLMRTRQQGTIIIHTRGETMRKVVATFCMFFVWDKYEIVDADVASRDPFRKTADDLANKGKMPVDGITLDIHSETKQILHDNETFSIEYHGKRVSGYNGAAALVETSCVWFLSSLMRHRRVRPVLTTVGHALAALESKSSIFSNWIYPATPRKFSKSILVEIASILFLFYILNWNLGTFFRYPIQPDIFWIGPTFKVDQYWGMFAPHPPMSSGWMVMDGQNAMGELVNVFPGHEHDPVDYTRPEVFSSYFPSQRWSQFLQCLPDQRLADLRLQFGRFVCREWNFWGRNPPEKFLKSFKITYYRADTHLDGKEAEIQSGVLWDHQCY
eukprot:TRINITY_DN5692_c0_g1_i1.p1 TRINITY_DN5692_c0_g1~~TRINITY_DN5692_c0_g1_i1.p1  ORF type:complete len:628 (+),score=116.69 TRINITY_DN5692_c0_g1_i1:259-2142(+)